MARPRWREASPLLHVRSDGRYVVRATNGKWRLGCVGADRARTLLRAPSGRHAYLTPESAKAAHDVAVPYSQRPRVDRAKKWADGEGRPAAVPTERNR